MERMVHSLREIITRGSREAPLEDQRQRDRERLENAGFGQQLKVEILYEQGVGEAEFSTDHGGHDHLIITPPPGEAGAKLIRSTFSLRRRVGLGEYETILLEGEMKVEVILTYSPEKIDHILTHPQEKRMGLVTNHIRKQAPGLRLGGQIERVEA